MRQGKKVGVVKRVSCAHAPPRLVHEELAEKVERVPRGGGEEVAKGRSWEPSYRDVIWQLRVALWGS